MNNRAITYILAILILVSVAHALSFDAEFIPVKNQVYLDENALFNVTITNDGTSEKRFQIYSPNVAWYVDYEPEILRVGPNQSIDITLELLPNAFASTGPQKVTIIIEDTRDDEQISKDLSIYVMDWSVKGRTYAASVEFNVDMEEIIDPRQKVVFDFYLRNRNRLNMDELTLKLESEHFNREIQFPFAGLEEKQEGMIFELDPLTPPYTGDITFSLIYQDEKVNEIKKAYEIIAFSDLIEDEKTTKELFKTTTKISIKNDGNYVRNETKDIEIGRIRSIFTTAYPKAEKTWDKGKTFLTWNLELDPMETYEITITSNYKPLIYALIIITLLIIFYYLARSPILVKKDLMIIGSAKSGISEMKILIYVKNRTSEVINNISIIDKVPNLAELIKESYLGTLEPDKILMHDKKGTIIKWKLPSIEPFEERVIAYRIKTKLNIIGGVSMPSCKVRFDTRSGRERTTESNKVKLKIR